jgi:peptidoglycan/LPS O-acetylase OafA/YrhL
VTAYRADIDGLRAVAVVAVVLYHAHLGPFAGGFIGVDVFFVISGYLIVGLILDEIAEARFSIATFYERRMRRLFPALFVLLAFCCVAAYFVFLPTEFEMFGHSVVATAAYVSNFLFWSEAGYFDAPPELKPLLHTWSLAVEEQFYLIFPAFLIALTKYRKHWLTRAMWIVAIVSFAISAASLVKHPDTAFYLPHTRMWELTIGALLVSERIPRVTTTTLRTVLAAVGLASIAASAILYSSWTPFPGPAALLPCLGAALVIHAGRDGTSPIHAFLSTRPVVYVGLISYSLYLWHWPLLVFARALTVRPLTALEATLLVAASFALAHLSWRFVEAPFRSRPPRFTRRQIFGSATAATLTMIAIGGFVAMNAGLPNRVPSDVATAAAGGVDLDLDFRRQCSNFGPEQVSVDVLCRLGATAGTPTFVLWGDSHAFAIAAMVAAAADDEHASGIFAGSGGCAPLLGVSRTTRRAFPCEEFNDDVVNLIRNDAALRTVVIASRWSLTADGRRYLTEAGADTFVRDAQSNDVSREENRAVFARGFERTVAALRDTGKHVVVVGPIPEVGYDVPTTMARNLWFDRGISIEPTVAAFLDRQRFVLDTLESAQTRYGFDLVQPYRSLCDTERCSVGTREHPYYADDNHLSRTGAMTLKPLLAGKL